MSINRAPEYYDNIYKDSDEYKKPFNESVYLDLWHKVNDLIPSSTIEITELGCGTGQFADMISEFGNPYSGYDFSSEAINQCNMKGLVDYQFEVTDLTQTKFGTDHNFFVALEIFEHTDDYQIIKNLGLGKEIIFTVPDFNDAAHVRYFHSINEVVERYKNVILFSHIEKFDSWFIAKGVTI